jgi:hypothetical protein
VVRAAIVRSCLKSDLGWRISRRSVGAIATELSTAISRILRERHLEEGNRS